MRKNNIIKNNEELPNKRKGGGKKSKRKGSSFERECSKMLSIWTGKSFRKSYGSGAWSKQQKTHIDLATAQAGDVIADKLFPYVVECKNQEGWCLDGLLYNQSSDLTKFWEQTLENAYHPQGKTKDEILEEVSILAHYFKYVREKEIILGENKTLGDKRGKDRDVQYKDKKDREYFRFCCFNSSLLNSQLFNQTPEALVVSLEPTISSSIDLSISSSIKCGSCTTHASHTAELNTHLSRKTYQLISLKVPILMFTKNHYPVFLMFPKEFIPGMFSMEFPHLILNNSYPSQAVLCLAKDFLMFAPVGYDGGQGQVEGIGLYGVIESKKKNKGQVETKKRKRKPRG